MKFYKSAGIILGLSILFIAQGQVLAMNRGAAIDTYAAELKKLSNSDMSERAENEVDALISAMEAEQYDVKVAFENAETQVNAMAKNSNRRDSALDTLDWAKGIADNFMGLDASDYINVIPSIGGTLPYVMAHDDFVKSQDAASGAIGAVRRILINPDQPGSVPSGDLMTSFIPQIIRQLFRFAWVAIFIALTVSGVFLVMAQGDDERLDKAKSMIYYTLIGFAFVAMAFALVKAVTDIDFFAFV